MTEPDPRDVAAASGQAGEERWRRHRQQIHESLMRRGVIAGRPGTAAEGRYFTTPEAADLAAQGKL